MKPIFFILGLISYLAALISCQEEYVPGVSDKVNIQNDWWANLYLNGKLESAAPALIYTYNVSSSADSLWVEDIVDSKDKGTLWKFKARAAVDYKTLTFRTDKYVSSIETNPKPKQKFYTIEVTITEGKIMPMAAKSPKGTPTDSIYMKIKFSDDPGTYEIKGWARTKFGIAGEDYKY